MLATVISSDISTNPSEWLLLVILFFAVFAFWHTFNDVMLPIVKSRTSVLVACFVMSFGLVTIMATYGRPFTAWCTLSYRLADGTVYTESKVLKFNAQDEMSCPKIGAIKAYVATPSFTDGNVTIANP